METLYSNIELTRILASSLVTLLGVFLSWFLKYKWGEYKQKKITREITQSKLIQTVLEQQLSTMPNVHLYSNVITVVNTEPVNQ